MKTAKVESWNVARTIAFTNPPGVELRRHKAKPTECTRRKPIASEKRGDADNHTRVLGEARGSHGKRLLGPLGLYGVPHFSAVKHAIGSVLGINQTWPDVLLQNLAAEKIPLGSIVSS